MILVQLALRPTCSTIHWIVDDLPLGIKFTADLQAVPRLRMSGAIHLLPPTCLQVCTGVYPLLVYLQCANYEALTALKDVREYTELNTNGEKSVVVCLKSGLQVINEVTSQ